MSHSQKGWSDQLGGHAAQFRRESLKAENRFDTLHAVHFVIVVPLRVHAPDQEPAFGIGEPAERFRKVIEVVSRKRGGMRIVLAREVEMQRFVDPAFLERDYIGPAAVEKFSLQELYRVRRIRHGGRRPVFASSSPAAGEIECPFWTALR